MTTGAERFKVAFEEAEKEERWSRNALAKALNRVRGGSYSSIRNYLSGDSEPPLDFLYAAAEKLGENPEWLAHGRGPRTPTVARAEEVAADDTGESPARKLMNELLDGLGVPAYPDDGAELNTDTFAGYRHRGLGLAPWVAPAAEVSRRLGKDVREIGEALRQTLEVAGKDVRTIGYYTLSDYILNMMTVFLTLAPREDRMVVQSLEDHQSPAPKADPPTEAEIDVEVADE